MNSIGVDFKLKNIEIDNRKIKLQIWDTAGQERFRTITTSYYKGAQAIVVVYDITEKESFDHVKNWMIDVDKFAKSGVLRVLVGNKCDLEHKRQVLKEQGQELADKYGIKFIETSAKETINIDELFLDTTKQLLNKQISIPGTDKKVPTPGKSVIDLQNKNSSTESKGCC